ncbi:hormone-sensitive lipase [Biomphalaria glabrata]
MDSPEKPERVFSTLSRELKSIALNNINYFQNGKHSHHAKFHLTFSLLYEYLDIGIEPSYFELCKHLTLCSYDFSESVKGNGYRSLLKVVTKCCLHLLQLCKYITSVRDSILFRKKLYAKELESYVSALGQLRGVLYYSLKLINYCQEGELFADEDRLNNTVADQLVLDVETLCQEPFYGRCLGFQFCDSMYKPVQVLAIAMASYSEGYLETSQMMQVASSVFNSGKYFLDPELRAQQVVKVTRTADIKFCKAFWGFSESPVMRQLPMFVCPSVDVNEVITLGPDSFKLPLADGSDTVDITPPCAHTGPGHVYVRLISAQLRDGQHAFRKSLKVMSPPAAKPKAAGLVIHIHGGGFVAQSSKSHEVYLREWAWTVDVPILSVDYSLAPEYPFPRALEECFYAYAWAVSNCHQLGSSGEKILIVGDSAGGNLAIATAMRAASFGIRSPDSVVCVYPCTVVRYTPSPARLLSLLDPILPVGLVSRCLAAYAGVNEEHPLSTPKMDDVHSQKSLTRIQFGTYETHDNDWLIVDENRSRDGFHDPVTPCTSEADTLSEFSEIQKSTPGQPMKMGFQKSESMFNMRSVDDSLPRQVSDVRRQSDTEIFSQLVNDGSCVFPAGSKVGSTVPPHTALNQGCSQKDTVNSFNLDGLQQRAKLMMESAHSLFSSLASFMPTSQNVLSNFPKFQAKKSRKHIIATHSSPVSLHSEPSSSNEISSFNNTSPREENDLEKNGLQRSKSSIAVTFSSQLPMASSASDLNILTDKNNDEVGINNSSLPAEEMLTSAASSSSLVDTSVSYATALSTPFSPLERRIGELDEECGCQPQEVVNDNTHKIETEVLATADGLNVEEDVQGGEEDRTTSSIVSITGPHVIFTTLPQTDVTNKPHLDFNIEHSDLAVSSTVITSEPYSIPTTDLHSDSNIEHQSTVHTEPQPTLITKPHASLLTEPCTIPMTTPVSSFTTESHPVLITELHPVSTTNQHSEPKEGCEIQQTKDIEAPCSTVAEVSDQSKEDKAFICAGGLSSGEVTPDMIADLPEENKQLLRDALEGLDSSPVECSILNEPNGENVIPEPSFPLEKIQSQGEAVLYNGMEQIDNICEQLNCCRVEPPVCCIESQINFTSNRVVNSEGVYPSHNILMDTEVDTENLDHPQDMTSDREVSREVEDSDSAQVNSVPKASQGQQQVKPPNTLKLKRSFRPNILSSESPMDPLSTASESSLPQPASSLEVSSSEPSPKILRCGSAPVLNSKSHSGSYLASPAYLSETQLPHFIKTEMSPSDFDKRTFACHSPLHKLRQAPVVKNPYMSPLLAPDDLLKGLTRVCIVGCHLDPLLDDSVSFARRLRKLDVPVELHLIDDLPHGFLNFALFSYEAKKASDYCGKKIAELLQSTCV